MPEKESKGIKKFFEEFKAFAMRGNVLDMAVGVVVGGAFTAIVTALVDDVINPLIGLFFKADFSDVVISLGGSSIKIGEFVNSVINFLIVAFVLFVVIKFINGLHKKPAAPAAPAEPTTKVCPYCQTEIPLKAVRCPPSWRASRRSMPDPATPVPEKSSCTKRYSCFFAVSVRCGACRRPNATAARHTGSSPPAGPRPTGRKHTPAGGTPQRRGTAPR